MRPYIPKAIRDSVKNRFKGRCGYCGEQTKAIHIDHIVPVINGGSDDPSNLMPSCRSCNNYKHMLSLEMFRTTLSNQVDLCRMYSVNFRFAERYGLVQIAEDKISFYFERVECANSAVAELMKEAR